jgi:hypothetical protein
LKAEKTAKAAYAKMMGSALRVEAAAHRQGEVATERELSFQVRYLPLRESLGFRGGSLGEHLN